MLSGFFSTLTISWFSPVLRKGWRKPLEAGDLLPLPPNLVCESAYHAFLRGLSSLPEPPHAVDSHETGQSDHVKADGAGNDQANGKCTVRAEPSTLGGKNAAPGGEGQAQGPNRGPPSSAPPPPSPEQHLYDTRALLRLIWQLHGPMLRRALALIHGYQICVFFQPVLLHELTTQLTHGSKGDGRIWMLPLLLFLSPLVGSLCKAQAQLAMIRIQIALRSQLTAAVYRKCLRLSAGARAGLPSGRVVNLMSADVAKICDFLYPQLTFMSVAPLAVVVSLIMLWFQIGWATLVGLAVLLLSTPVSNLAVRATQRHRNEMLKAADGRMKLVGQFLVGVRVIKMYHWERTQAAEIERCRALELRALRNMIPSKVAMQTLLYVLPQLAGVLSLLAVGLTDPQALTAARAFSSLVLFQIMRFPLLTLSTGLVELGAAIISSHRITAFMAAEEQRNYVTRITQPPGTAPLPPPSHTPRVRSLSNAGKAPTTHTPSLGPGPGPGSISAAAAAWALPQHSQRSTPQSEGDERGGVPAFVAGRGSVAAFLRSQRSTSEGGSPGGVGRAAGAGAGQCTETAAMALAGLRIPSVTVTPHLSRTGLSLAGVEPGLTIRAAGFRWAVVRKDEEGEREAAMEGGDGGTTSAGGGGSGGGEGCKAGRLGSFRRKGSMPRPFMEVVDEVGESLAAGAVVLGVRLQRALTRRRELDATYGIAGSPYDTPRLGAGVGRRSFFRSLSSFSFTGGGTSLFHGVSIGGVAAAAEAGAGSGAGGHIPEAAPAGTAAAGGRKAVDEERVGLLQASSGSAGRMDAMAGLAGKCGSAVCTDVYGGKEPGDGLSVMVAFDDSSDGSGSGTVGGGGIDGGADACTAGRSAFARLAVGGGGCGGDVGKGNQGGGDGVSGSDRDSDTGGTPPGPFALGEIDLRVRPGELVCVVGRVGSGKSSLISAALGEMEAEMEEGDVVGLGGRVAYVAQQAWVINASLLENVLMGKAQDEAKWSRCVEACCLGPDLELLPAGRETEIGEKGLNLSGGQKQRLSLARAMYQEADIYLLDDPLSAVDVHVGAHIFNCMIRGALAGSAVLLVTNGVQYLPAADRIVVMNAGEVVMQGTYDECMEEPLFRSMLEEFRAEQEQGQEQEQQAGQGVGKDNKEAPDAEAAEASRLGGELNSEGAAETDGEGGDHGTGLRRCDGAADSGGGGGSSYRGENSGGGAGRGCSTSGGGGASSGGGCRNSSGERGSPAPQEMPSTSLGVSTSAYGARRTSVELARQQRQRQKCTTDHMADFDEGNVMMDSLLRMSGDGGGDGAGDNDFGGRGSSCGGGGGAGAGRWAEEARPLLLAAARISTTPGDPTCSTSSSTSQGNRQVGGNDSGACRGGCGGGGGPSGGGDDGDGGGGGVSSRAAGHPSSSFQGALHGVAVEKVNKGRITVAEDRELGQVKWRVYGTYMRAFHLGAAVAMVLFWATEQGTRLATNAWLARWSRSQSASSAAAAADGRGGGGGLGRFAGVYLLLGGAYAVATFLRSTTNNLGSYRASKIIHALTLSSLVAAPLSFFEATPVGRILNRLSRDVDEMDYNLAMYQQQLGNCVMRLLATIVFLCVLQPAFTGVVVPLAIIYFVLQKYFRRTSIELQRIDSVTRSPVYANFAETMAGLDTLRAYRMQERFKSRHEAMVDTNATAYYNARVADEWLSLRLDLIGSVIVLSIAALNVGLRSVASVSPAMVALALAEAIDLTSFLNYAVKVSALVESRYNAVERLLVYAQLQPEECKEEAARGPPFRPAGLPAWPATGELEFRDVWMSYRQGLDPVLKSVSFKVLDGQKIGIVGRTGSGKSSLIVALFRLVEPQRGQMLLDGVDLRSLGLGPARTALSAIPQEPVLFSGNVRSNLDPWSCHSDVELWEALGVVALREHVRALGGLSATVSEGGGNFSVGQRQLVCVARALLRQPRLLVADEATASVDPETDALIQRAIRTHFKMSTVLAIAHRLNTILDADAVLFMDAGRVGEFGPVPELLATPGSAFAAMVRDAGLMDAASGAGPAAAAAALAPESDDVAVVRQ